MKKRIICICLTIIMLISMVSETFLANNNFESAKVQEFRKNEVNVQSSKEARSSSAGVNINVNTTYKGNVADKYDVNKYNFTLSSAGAVSVNFQHENLFDTERYWEIRVYNESALQMMYVESAGTDINITSAELGLPAGNYYIEIESSDSYSSNHSDKTYTFKINYTVSSTWETEDNYNYSNADIISVNKEYNGATLTSGDVDYYKFVVNQAGKYTINFQHKNLKDTDRYWKLNLYNINTKELLSTDVKGSGTTKNSSSIYLKKGTYYLRITTDEYGQYYGNHSNTTYKFKVCFTFMTKKPTLKTTSIDFNKVKLKWSKVADIKGYVVYRSTSKNGKYKAIKTINGKDNCTYTDKTVKAGKTYYYKVRAYKKIVGKTYYSKYSSVIKVKPVPTIASIKNVKLKNRNVTLTWKKQSGISGYEIYMSTKKSSGYKKIKTVKKASSVKYTKNTLKVGKRYYFKVRAYKVVDGKKVYGKYSAIKSIKIKQEAR